MKKLFYKLFHTKKNKSGKLLPAICYLLAAKKIFFVFCILSFMGICVFSANADDESAITKPAMVSVFSTSSDWEAITGLRLAEYEVWVGRDKRVGTRGTEVYYLDAFPCYGQTEDVRAWVSPRGGNWFNDTDARLRIVCLTTPKTITLAYRDAARDDYQGRTKGMMTCDVVQKSGKLIANLDNCAIGEDWNKME